MKAKKIVFAGLFLLSTSLSASHPQSADAQFTTIANAYEKALFNYMPELGLIEGNPNVALDRFTDVSSAAYKRWLKQEDNFLKQLSTIDEKSFEQSPKFDTYLLLKETLQDEKASRICQSLLWYVDPMGGWHNNLAMVAEKQPVGTAAYRKQALTRWKTFGQYVDGQIANLKQGVQEGYTAPKPAVSRVLMQLNTLMNSPIENSPYYDFARRDNDPVFKQEVAKIVKTVVNPALKKYADYLQNDYLPVAREAVGVSALPHGDACYLAKLKQETTLDVSPKTIHDLGLKTIQQLENRVGDMGEKTYGTRDMTTIFQRAKQESVGYFSTEQDMLNYDLAALARAKEKVPAWFNLMPKSPGIIKPYPLYRAKSGAVGEYMPPNDTGTEPGIFFINTYNPTQHSRIDLEGTLFHELIPGHHFQIALVFENKSLPKLNRYLFNAGFVEGWALYAERLADEMGLYRDENSRLGMLSNESLRASRLVVDTGIHAFNWSRQQAVDYMKKHTALDENMIQSEVDRYIMIPGQATAYMLGRNEILALRQLAKTQLGDKFDIRAFHDEVLKHGAVSLPILRNNVLAWLAAQKTS